MRPNWLLTSTVKVKLRCRECAIKLFGWNSKKSTSSIYLLNAGLDPVWATRKLPD